VTTTWLDVLTIIAAVIVGVVGSARFVRLVTADKWPPIVKFRIWWEGKTEGDNPDEGWVLLFKCLWCFAPWVVAVNLAAALLSDLHPAWWVINGWLAASYAASWLVFHDED
jgi:hypothetical protein